MESYIPTYINSFKRTGTRAPVLWSRLKAHKPCPVGLEDSNREWTGPGTKWLARDRRERGYRDW